MKRALLLLAIAAIGLADSGCGSEKLETGYVFTPLGDSSSKRRGYYADPFSPEARAAQTEQQNTGAGATGPRQVPGQ
ncbi:MAG: hypothetical protein JWM57_1799 [Phycisphaerales bacterium]|nr:hypothetical protein [Phycisphaerales bacterium]